MYRIIDTNGDELARTGSLLVALRVCEIAQAEGESYRVTKH